MRLPLTETERFYRIWFALLQYVNKKLNLAPTFPEVPGTGGVQTDDAIQLRDALWADDALRKQFIADNPAQLDAADLALVESWQHRITGTFTILRSLQKYTIFLSEEAPTHAYGVVGLVSPIEEIIPLPLPVYARATLLPFEQQIIYDSLLLSYNVVIGPNIRRRLQSTYRQLQEREGIITSLQPEDQSSSPEAQRAAISARNQKTFNAFRRELRKTGLSEQMVNLHAETLEDFAHTTLLAANPPQGLLELTLPTIQSYLQEHPGKQPVTSFKRFVRFLINTDRVEYAEGESLANFLKQLNKKVEP